MPRGSDGTEAFQKRAGRGAGEEFVHACIKLFCFAKTFTKTNKRKKGLIMAKNITEEVYQAVAQVKHPEIDCSLNELGMIKDMTVKDKKVAVTLALPMLGIPVAIRDYLMNSLRGAVTQLGLEFEVKLTGMNQEERQIFFAMAQERWKAGFL
jgi:metal-sulfur cluster biosynthetic enzyme